MDEDDVIEKIVERDIGETIKKYDSASKCDPIDRAYIKLMQKQIDEQIRSSKVLEGILRDIGNGISRIADNIENELIERKIMKQNWQEKLEKAAGIINQVLNDEAIIEDPPEVESSDKPKLIHLHFATNRFAICGAMGTPSQPFTARMNEQVVDHSPDVTCPDCLKIIAEH